MKPFKGITLIELVIVVAILALSLSVAAPYLNHWLVRREIAVQTSRLVNMINYARTKAIISQSSLLLRPLNNGSSWAEGAELVSLPELTSKRLYQWQWHAKRISINWNGFQSKKAIKFSPEFSSASLSGRFIVAEKHKPVAYKKAVIVNRMGRVRVSSLI